jgi:hypothetical protein
VHRAPWTKRWPDSRNGAWLAGLETMGRALTDETVLAIAMAIQ